MSNLDDVCQRYLQACRFPDTTRKLTHRSVFFEYASSRRGGALATIYSYGYHFPMAEYLPAGQHGRTSPVILLNGDRASVTTNRHQGALRAAVRDAQSTWEGLQSIVIPFSALTAARIDRGTIRPLHVRDDRIERWQEPVPGDYFNPIWGPIPAFPTGEPTPYYSGVIRQEGQIPAGNGRVVPGAVAARTLRWYDYQTQTWNEREPDDETVSLYYNGAGVEWDGRQWYVPRSRHWLGDSLFTAGVMTARSVTRALTVGEIIRDCADACRWHPTDTASRIEALPLEVTTSTTFLKRRKFISSFDYNEPNALYYLATMPKGVAKTVEHATDELAPRAVHAAYARSIDVERQGDIFAIATPLTDADVYGRAVTRARRSQFTQGAIAKKGEVGRPTPAEVERRYRAAVADKREVLRRYRENRKAQWAQWDSLRGTPRARRNRAMRVGNTAPRVWDGSGYSVGYFHARQALELATQATMAKYDVPRHRLRESLRGALSIHGTTHTATEVVKVKGGATYIRGRMYHEPSLDSTRFGGRDHVARKLGDGSTWYLAVRNTVPRQG